MDFGVQRKGDVHSRLKPGPRRDDGRREQVRVLHAQGLTDRQIAKRLKVHPPWVNRIRHGELGLPLNPAKAWDRGKARKLYESGLTDRQIGERVGVQPLTILHWRFQEGLPANSKRKPVNR